MKLFIGIFFVATVFASSAAVNSATIYSNETSTSTTTKTVVTTTIPTPVELPVSNSEIRWDTRTTDPTAYWPNTTSPISTIAVWAQTKFACIRFVESRNHLTSVSYAGAGGLYQFMPLIWAHYGGLAYAPTPEKATGNQQDQVAVNVFKANGGFYPEWQDPICTN
jgi:hypothetical protein